jgi:GMP synthase C terminal domain
MCAIVGHPADALLGKISNLIINKVNGISYVMYDVTGYLRVLSGNKE